jgi:hypothetical protein
VEHHSSRTSEREKGEREAIEVTDHWKAYRRGSLWRRGCDSSGVTGGGTDVGVVKTGSAVVELPAAHSTPSRSD